MTAAIIAADHLFFSLNPVASLTSGTLFNVEVQARDSSQGNAVDAGFIGNVTLTAAAVGGSSFTAGNVVAATNGVASFNVFLNNAANTYQITASAAGLTDGLSSTFNVTANHLAFPAAIPDVEAGTPFNVQVQARDADTNLAENFSGSVSINAAAPAARTSSAAPQNAAAVSGSATFTNVVLNAAAANYTVTASSAGLTGAVSNNFDVTAAIIAADHLFFSLNPVASLTSGTLFNVEVQARDSSQGNAVDAGFIGNVTLTAAAVGGSSFTAGNVVAATNGVASFNVFLNNAANTYQITASAAGLTDGLSSTFNVTANHLAFPAAIPNHQAGTPFGVTVEARDANNIVAENFSGNVSLNAAATGGSNFNGGTAERGRRRRQRDVHRPRPQQRRRRLSDHRLLGRPDQRAQQQLQRDRHPPRGRGDRQRPGRRRVQRHRRGPRRQQHRGRELQRQRQPRRRRHRRLELQRRHRERGRRHGQRDVRRPRPQRRRRRLHRHGRLGRA